MKRLLPISGLTVLAAAPFLALADTLEDVVKTVGDLIDLATPIVVALALVYFFYGLANLIFNSAESDKRKGAIQTMIYGIIALFVMVSVWGIVNVLQDTFNVGGNQTITPPSVQR